MLVVVKGGALLKTPVCRVLAERLSLPSPAGRVRVDPASIPSNCNLSFLLAILLQNSSLRPESCFDAVSYRAADFHMRIARRFESRLSSCDIDFLNYGWRQDEARRPVVSN